MRMELRQLEYFVAVAEEANFTRAAQKVHVAQPGVSAQILRLEHELGQTLLERTSRGVRLTEAGAAVLPYARAALQAVAATRLVVDEIRDLVRGHVAIGMITACTSVDLFDLLAGFHVRHPDVEITVSEANTDRLIEDLLTGRLDMALVGLSGGQPEGTETQTIADEPLVAAVCLDDPLAAQTSVSLELLRNRALISLPRGTGLRTAIDDACAAVGFKPRIAFEASSPMTLVHLATRGLGVAILPESVANAHPPELHVIAITHPQLRARIELAWRAEGLRSPAARALAGYAREMLAGRSSNRTVGSR